MSANEPGREMAGHEPGTRGTDAAAASVGPASSSRRRALLRGIGKAGAIAGAALPLQPLLAADRPPMRMNKSGKNYLCSVSGNMSLLHSGVSVTTNCGGKAPSHYQVCTGSGSSRVFTNWPSSGTGCPLATRAFNSVFLAGPSTTLGDLVMRSPLNDESHWVVALLNSYKNSSNFPYSGAEVAALYRQELANGSRTAVTFFTTYLETQTS